MKNYNIITKIMLVAFAIFLTSLTSSCSPDDGIDGKDGIDGINGINGTNGTPVYYNPITISAGLNSGSVNVSSTNTILNIGTKTFYKIDANTQVDLKLRSNIYSGVFSTSPMAIKFELLVDGNVGNASSNYWIYTSNSIESVTLDSTFSGLSIGNHTITIRASTNLGTATGVLVDQGNYGGKIIVQER